jgi:hypothetical protein
MLEISNFKQLYIFQFNFSFDIPHHDLNLVFCYEQLFEDEKVYLSCFL